MNNCKPILAAAVLCTVCAVNLGAGPRFITYEKYGARGDGKTDDMDAIAAAHEAANRLGLPVKVKSGKTYYIGESTTTAVIRTDVDFGKARFIIDDTRPEKLKKSVFKVESCLEAFKLKDPGPVKAGQKNLGVTLPCRCLVVLENSARKLYIRYGVNENSGQSQREVLIVEKDGSIDPKTAVMWDYDTVTSATAYPIDEKPLTIKGGVFTTIANDQPTDKTPYAARNITVNRSNTRIEGLTHLVEAEGEHGAPYSGFLSVSRAADVVISDCILTGHKTYVTTKKKGRVSRGTYDLGINTAANVRLERITQSDDIDDRKHWGLMASNYGKNLTLDGCRISRFDAHQGVENVTLKNCVFGHMGVRMVGCGTIYMENCELRYGSLIALRGDYGSTWDGEIIVRNCIMKPSDGVKEITLLSGYNKGTHDFGYPCRIPHLMDIDGLVIDDSAKDVPVSIFASFGRNPKAEGLFPFGTDCRVVLKNVSVKSGKEIGLSPNPELFKDAVVEKQ